MANNYIEKKIDSLRTQIREAVFWKKSPPHGLKERKTGTQFAPAQSSSSVVRSLQGSSHPSPLGSSQCFLVV